MSISIPNFRKARVLVVGDVMLDRYLSGAASRISPEAPVPVVHVKHKNEKPGGAGNVALNASVLGAAVTLLGLVGSDDEAKRLEDLLMIASVSCRFAHIDDMRTITKLRILSQHQQLLRLDFEEPFHQDSADELMDDYRKALEQTDVVILSDYGKGVLQSHSKYFISLAREKNIPVLIDPKSKDFSVYAGASLITPNFKEFQAVVGPCANDAEIIAKAQVLLRQHDIESILITRGERGMTLVRTDSEPVHILTRARDVYDVTGAGDTVIGLLGSALAAGSNLVNAIELANVAAGIVVGKLGAETVTESELRQALQFNIDGHVMTEEQLLSVVAEARARGEKIVMTNGCFDVLHAGHIYYLNEAKKLGTRLIIAVNDDESVKRLKGNARPINQLHERMAVLAGLKSVDWVVPFSEDTPARIIGRVLPDILVKGGDYKPEEVAGGDAVVKNGGTVRILGFIDGCSTSSVIDRIQREREGADK